eukprot:SAG31_NODE_2075_length_6509_cov_2.710764_5_plen_61_part_00
MPEHGIHERAGIETSSSGSHETPFKITCTVATAVSKLADLPYIYRTRAEMNSKINLNLAG